MKKILITGANSYIGTSFEKYINTNFPKEYIIDTVDLIDGSWRDKSFAGYDSVLHVAGIAHQRETKKNEYIYYKVNRDLAIEVTKKAKKEGVKQFIFISSMSIYGMDVGTITKETLPQPKTHYGKSKLEAEKFIMPLADESFKTCILRPPMVYGKGCKGNFNTVHKLVKKLPFFPYVKNQRSMLYIDNLSSFMKLCVDKELTGIYFPQNRDYVSTMDMVKGIALAIKKNIRFDYMTGLIVQILRLFDKTAKKGFGTLIYLDTEEFCFSYIVVENEQSFIKSIL